MRHTLALLILTLFTLEASAVCQLKATSMNFDGTAFAQTPFQLTAKSLQFFKGSKREFEITYDPPRDQWCYRSQYQTKLRPRIGCIKLKKHSLVLNGKRLPVFILRNLRDEKIASLRVRGNQLDLDFLLASGRASGKRMTFTAPVNEHQNLEVRAWNCPNENFLSCMGAQLQLKWDEGLKDVDASSIRTAEMSKRLGHYEASCQGLREILPARSGASSL